MPQALLDIDSPSPKYFRCGWLTRQGSAYADAGQPKSRRFAGVEGVAYLCTMLAITKSGNEFLSPCAAIPRRADEGRKLPYLTPAEAAALLRVDRKTIYTLIHNKRLTSLRVGRAWRIAAESLAGLGDPTPRGPGRPPGSLNKKKQPRGQTQ